MSIRTQLFSFGVLLAVAVGGTIGWKEMNKVNVDFSSHHENAEIFLAEAKVIDGREPKWLQIKPGSIRIAKRAYYFKLVTPELQRTGLIAINDGTPVVLK